MFTKPVFLIMYFDLTEKFTIQVDSVPCKKKKIWDVLPATCSMLIACPTINAVVF